MKYILFLLLGLLGAGCAKSQAKAAFYKPEETVLKVLLTKSGLTVTYKDQRVAVTTTQALDSLIKNIPDLQHQKIEYESQDADGDQSLEVLGTLQRCNCHLITKARAQRR